MKRILKQENQDKQEDPRMEHSQRRTTGLTSVTRGTF